MSDIRAGSNGSGGIAGDLEIAALRRAVETRLIETERAERYRDRQRRVRTGRWADARPHPLEYDESGFPLPQPHPGFAWRVARLLGPK